MAINVTVYQGREAQNPLLFLYLSAFTLQPSTSAKSPLFVRAIKILPFSLKHFF